MYPCRLVFLLPTFQVGLYALYLHFTPLSIGFCGKFEKIQKSFFPEKSGASLLLSHLPCIILGIITTERRWKGMMISTKGRYALRFLVDIAEHQAEGYVPLKDVAERQGISEKYLESIVKTLVRADVLTGLRGKGGGYRLRKSPDQYGVREILSLLEGPLVPVACLGPGDQSCDRMTSCRTLPLWQGLEQVIQEYLDKYTIADLMARDESAGFDYVI